MFILDDRVVAGVLIDFDVSLKAFVRDRFLESAKTEVDDYQTI